MVYPFDSLILVRVNLHSLKALNIGSSCHGYVCFCSYPIELIHFITTSQMYISQAWFADDATAAENWPHFSSGESNFSLWAHSMVTILMSPKHSYLIIKPQLYDSTKQLQYFRMLMFKQLVIVNVISVLQLRHSYWLKNMHPKWLRYFQMNCCFIFSCWDSPS